MKFCKDCGHREPPYGYCPIKDKHVPRKTDKNGNNTSCDSWIPKKGVKHDN